MKRFVKKITSMLLVVSLLLIMMPNVSVSAYNEYPTLIYLDQDFETHEIGESPWDFYLSGNKQIGDFTVAEMPYEGNENNKALFLKNVEENSNRWAGHFTSSNPINHTFVFGFDFNLTNSFAKNEIMLHIDNETLGESLYKEYGRDIHFMSLGKNIEISGTTIEGVSLLPNKWYKLDIVLDPQRLKADVYLDGVLKNKNVNLNKFETLCGFIFMAPSQSCDYYIDNLRIYKSDCVMKEDEYQAAVKLWRDSPFGFNDEYNQSRSRQYDEIVWNTVYGKIVGKIGTRYVWCRDRIVDFSGPIKNDNGELIVPIRNFCEMFGGQIEWDEGARKVTIQIDGKTMEFFDGESKGFFNGKLSRLDAPVGISNGIFYIPLEIIADFLKLQYSIDEQLIFFEQELRIDPELTTIMLGRQTKYPLKKMVMKYLDAMLSHRLPTPEEILSAYKQVNPDGVHPKGVINDFEWILEGMENDQQFAKLVNAMVKNGENTASAGILKFKITDLRGNTNIASMCKRLRPLAFSYVITKDEKYKDIMLEQIDEILEGGADFSVGQFLEVGESAYELGCAYTWMHNYMTEEERQKFSDLIYNVLLYAKRAHTIPLYIQPTANTVIAGNQNLIIATGLITASIALIDEYPELCSETISNWLRATSYFFPSYAPEGVCLEGLSYWLYTCDYMIPFFQILENTFGTDYETLESPGILNMLSYAMSQKGSTGGFYDGDASPQSPLHSMFMYIGKKTDNMGLVNYKKNALSSSLNEIISWVFNSGTKMMSPNDFPGDSYFESTGSMVMRTGWTKSDTAVYFHGGANNDGHGHRDIGNVTFDMSGERWGTELPKEDYETPYRPENKEFQYAKCYYRNEAEGHNVVVANLCKENTQGMNPNAKSRVEKTEFGELTSYGIMDLSEGNSLYEYGLRGVMLDKLNNELIIQDDYKTTKPTHFWWFMNFEKTDIEISENGKFAILTKNNKRILASLISDGDEKFQVLEAKPLEQYNTIKPGWQTPNDGFNRLAVNNENTDHFKLTVTFRPLLEGENFPETVNEIAYLSEWKMSSSKRAEITGVTVDGVPLRDFDPKVYVYDTEVMTDKDPVPDIKVTADSKYEVEVNKANAVPGTTTVLLKRNGAVEGRYDFGIVCLNDTSKFINDKQLPIKSFNVTSEPEPNNSGSNLFDGLLDTKYATNEVGGSVTIDFGKVQKIDEVRMAFIDGASRNEYFTIEYSVDGVNYEVAYDGESNGLTTQLQSFDVGLIDAQYIRVSFYGNSGGSSWVSVSELCIFSE